MSHYVPRMFFEREVHRIVAVARDMASAFEDGGRLYVIGDGGSAADAVAIEFVHPVIARRPPLPAIALSADVTAIDQDLALAHVLRVQARRGDILLALSTTRARRRRSDCSSSASPAWTTRSRHSAITRS